MLKKQVKPSRLDGDLPKGLALRSDRSMTIDHYHDTMKLGIVGASWGWEWSSVIEVRDLHHEVRLDMGSFLCIICLYGVVPGALDAADRHVFVAGGGGVGGGGPGRSPGPSTPTRSNSFTLVPTRSHKSYQVNP